MVLVMPMPMLTDAASEFSSPGLQVDALAVATLPSSVFSDDAASGSELDTVGNTRAFEDDAELPLLAVALSQLEGNCWGGGVALLDGTTLEQLCSLQMDAGVSSLAWCGPERDVLACACDDGDVRLLRLSTDVDFALVPFQTGAWKTDSTVSAVSDDSEGTAAGGDSSWGHDDVVTGVSASAADKTKLASCSWDHTVKLWDIASPDRLVATFEGHIDLVWDVAMHPTTGHMLASASQDRSVIVWDSRRPQTASMVINAGSPAFTLDWHPRKDYVFAVGLEDGAVATFDTRAPKHSLNRLAAHDGPVHAVKYSRFHEDLLASGGDDARVALITDSCSPEARVVETSASPVGSTAPPSKAAIHRDYVRALAWFAHRDVLASDRRRPLALLATGSWDKMVRTWRSDAFAAQSLLERAL